MRAKRIVKTAPAPKKRTENATVTATHAGRPEKKPRTSRPHSAEASGNARSARSETREYRVHEAAAPYYVGPTVRSLDENRRLLRKMIAFGWYGGKFSHLDWLLPLLPCCHHYCEPFGGSAAVLINRPPSPVETYNDVDGEVVNFFRVLREQKDELLYQIGMTPFSREEFLMAIRTNGNGKFLSDVERARRFFVRARQVRTGLAQTASVGRWANCLNTSRAGMAGAVSRWLGSVAGLEFIATRLLHVQIENDSATNVIARYDGKDTLFYCDPPYPHASRADRKAYSYEMNDAQHVELSRVLHKVKGKAAISGYDCDLMQDLYSDWRCHREKPKKAMSTKKERQEVLWTSY